MKKAMPLVSVFILLLSTFLFSAHSARTYTIINGADLQVVQNQGADVLVIQNQDPLFWFTDLAFNNIGIAHDTVGIQDFVSTNITDYRIIVVGTEIGTLDQVKSVLDSKSPEIEAWIGSGGCIAVFGQYVNATVYDLNGKLCRDLGSGYYRWLPNGPEFVSHYSDYVTITNSAHPLMANLTDDDLSMWDTSGDGYFVSPPGETLVTHWDFRSVLYAQSFGNGKIVATSLDADYHSSIYNGRGDSGKLQARKLIENIMNWFQSNVAIDELVGDVNRDGIVNILDLVTIARHYKFYEAMPTWDQACDINGDKIIDILDITEAAVHYGERA